MGAYGGSDFAYLAGLGEAMYLTPWVLALQTADLRETYLPERKYIDD